jgi:hypothetical protein
MKNNLKKAWQLSGAERWLLVQAFLALPLVSLGLRWFGLCWFQAMLQQFLPKTSCEDERGADLDQARATARLVRAAARYVFFRPTCLPQSIVLWWLLRRQGLGGDLRIGVKPEPSYLEAHAWVEFQGQPLNDSADVAWRFAPFPLEASPRWLFK